ncbi:hypothetical protein M3Y99_01144500 [Aphelenchoides fujianensis]|nr:hypothetical protein M3Y99_01144500 [Aphelenchoides fujianensis]
MPDRRSCVARVGEATSAAGEDGNSPFEAARFVLFLTPETRNSSRLGRSPLTIKESGSNLRHAGSSDRNRRGCSDARR